MPASTTWMLTNATSATIGGHVRLSRIAMHDGANVLQPTAITSNFPPAVGSVENLLVDDATDCTFSAEQLAAQGFKLTLTFDTPVDCVSAVFKGPSASEFICEYALSTPGDFESNHGGVKFPTGGDFSAPEATRFMSPRRFERWLERPTGGTRYWRVPVLSHTGQIIVFTGGQYTYLSRNYGSTFEYVPALDGSYEVMKMDASGQIILAARLGYTPLISRDYGVTFTAVPGLSGWQWYGGAVSKDGQKMFMLAQTAGAKYSHDGGLTWNNPTGLPANYPGFKCAATGDGQFVFCGGIQTGTHFSRDGGVTFTPFSGITSGVVNSVAVSADGSFLIISSTGGTVVSYDLLNSWTVTTVFGTGWSSMSLSDDASRKIFSSTGGMFSLLTESPRPAGSGLFPIPPNDYSGVGISGNGRVAVVQNSYGYIHTITLRDPSAYTPAITGHEPRLTEVVSEYQPPNGVVLSAEFATFHDVNFGGNGRVYGTVSKRADTATIPVSSRVRLFEQSTSRFLQETRSDPATGAYEFRGLSPNLKYYVVTFDDGLEYRAVAADNLSAEVVE